MKRVLHGEDGSGKGLAAQRFLQYASPMNVTGLFIGLELSLLYGCPAFQTTRFRALRKWPITSSNSLFAMFWAMRMELSMCISSCSKLRGRGAAGEVLAPAICPGFRPRLLLRRARLLLLLKFARFAAIFFLFPT